MKLKNMAKFKAGDVVVLKSGGPKMTVQGYLKTEDTKLSCTWFNDDKERLSDNFYESNLDLAE